MRSTSVYKRPGENLSSGVKKKPSDSASKTDGQDSHPPTSAVRAKPMTDWKERCMEAESILADCCVLMEDTAEAEHNGERWCGNDEMLLCGKIDDHFRKYMK